MNSNATLAPADAGPAPETVCSTRFGDLTRIYEPDVNLCIIQRMPDPAAEDFATALLVSGTGVALRSIVLLGSTDFDALLPDLCRRLTGYETWLRDLERIAGAFAELFGREQLALRLMTLQRPMCPRFHVDQVPVRLACSYGGPGTEWLPEWAVDRSRLGRGGDGLDDRASGLVRDPDAIRTLPAQTLALLKGERWEGNEGRGAVHRSPALPAGHHGRLLLTLDLPEQAHS